MLLLVADRPGTGVRYRRAGLASLSAAALGLLAAQVISHLWARERPFAAHPGQTVLLVDPSTDPSFPSDHATAAFAIAFAVLLVCRRPGSMLLVAAIAVACSRVLVGAHYPGDVLAGAGIGLLSAFLVTYPGSRVMDRLTETASVVVDPVAARLWRVADGWHRRPAGR